MFEIEGVVYYIDFAAIEAVYSQYKNDTEGKVYKMEVSDVLVPTAKEKVLDVLTLFLEKVLNESTYDIILDDESDSPMEQSPSYKLAFNTLLKTGIIKIHK